MEIDKKANVFVHTVYPSPLHSLLLVPVSPLYERDTRINKTHRANREHAWREREYTLDGLNTNRTERSVCVFSYVRAQGKFASQWQRNIKTFAIVQTVSVDLDGLKCSHAQRFVRSNLNDDNTRSTISRQSDKESTEIEKERKKDTEQSDNDFVSFAVVK